MRAMQRTLLVVCLFASLACEQGVAKAESRPSGTREQATFTVTESIYDGGLSKRWKDYGWAPRKLQEGKPAELNLAQKAGWIIAAPGFTGKYGGLVFRYKAPRAWGDFLEVRLDGHGGTFPRVIPLPGHTRDLQDGWSEVWIALSELNPREAPFDRVVFRADLKLPAEATVLLDGIGFTQQAPKFARELTASGEAPRPSRPGTITVRCGEDGHAISPLIYGIAYDPRLDHKSNHQWDLGATARRWGGNHTSRYNWKLGNAWNTAVDWYWRNVNYTSDPSFTYTKFLDQNAQRNVATALTVPLIGWVAKDTSSVSFPKSLYPDQKSFDPYQADAGNGVGKDGKPLTPPSPSSTSVEASPEFVGEWVREIRKRDEASGARSVQMYILDNEPALWSSTHRDVHPEPVGYDELLDRTLRYGAAVRKADPDALIAGPAAWGWLEYNYSAVDAEAGVRLRPDSRRHGGGPLLAWYLKKIAEYEQKTSTRLLDVLDVHFYPQGKGIRANGGATDADTAARRIRSTRALWDPDYVDESWIDERIQLFPLLKKWIAENRPGTKISIGEYNFGAEGHMSGGLAQAEALGRFAEAGIYSAFFWTYPPDQSPAYWAFRAYRNFDGQGGAFLDRFVPASAPEQASAFASVDESGKTLVVVALNFDPARPLDAKLDLRGCKLGADARAEVFTYDGRPDGFAKREAPSPGAAQTLPPYSINVFRIHLGGADEVTK